jgi:signal transduction histidine kinase
MEGRTLSSQSPALSQSTGGPQFDGVTTAYLYDLFGGRWPALAAFLVCYFLAAVLGYHFKVDLAIPALMWPAAGVLFSALWMTDTRVWPVLLLVQVLADTAVSGLFVHPLSYATTLLYSVSNSLGGVIGAALARRYVSDRPEVRTARLLQMLAVTAVGSMASSLPGAWGNQRQFPDAPTLFTQLEVWAAGNWLGLAAVMPVLNTWLSPMRRRHPELALRSVRELVMLVVLLAVATAFVFGQVGMRPTLLLQVPFSLSALVLYAAFRLPPRWVATLVLAAAVACVELTNRGYGPFGPLDVFSRHALLQGFLASLVVLGYAMSMALAETRLSLGRLGDSEARYRSLVELSTEAIWRVELEAPMPVSLPPAEQVQWLRRHARLAESNRAYLMVDPSAAVPGNGHWQRQIPWSDEYERHIEALCRNGYSLDGLRFAASVAGRKRTFLTAFSGVVREGRLLRIWGVARDISELEELNQQLLREQDRLRGYAQQLATAEEKARRATAIDLHDGIGQSLAGMAMTLNVARDGAGPHTRSLIEQVQERLRAVQNHTRDMISDLSPPGLYELGLGPALQWLAVRARSHDHMNVALELQVDESRVRISVRVLAFKVVRELLHNAAKHAGVDAASVQVRSDAERLHIEVHDQGRGFEWREDRPEDAGRGFGLWSISERVREAGGRLTVQAGPGTGTRVVVDLPLREGYSPGTFR